MNTLTRRLALASVSALFLTSLVACANQKAAATYLDAAPDSPYGKLSDFSLENKGLTEGQQLSFTVTPAADFLIDNVTVNGKVATPVEGKTNVYTWTLVAGVNKIAAAYKVDSSIDFVSRFKLNIDDATFTKVMDGVVGSTGLDFRTDGIEQVQTTYLNSKAFINYVDGDTTHVETLNYGYTVKIRYLSIDTPESTSDVEEWGKAASNYNHEHLSTAKHIILESQGWARGDKDKAATADGNQRSLAYVWYTDVATPVKDDFKCLNLEMVYQGFSSGIGSLENAGSDFYYIFDKANKSAQANKRHMYSGEKDPLYWYDSHTDPLDLDLKDLYDTTTKGKTDSPYCNDNKFYRIHGYVSRKVANAFYIQNKADYKQTGTALPQAYGIYVFTYTQTPIAVGDELNVIGILSSYGGAYQLQGISYHDFGADLKRDTIILSSGNTIVPIKVSSAQFSSTSCYDDVLVEYTDDFYCFNKTSTYQGETSDSGEGGIQEVNKYNTHYPFYNSTNKIISYAKLASKTGQEIRFTLSEEILLNYKLETAYSYKFFGGGTNYYYPGDATKVYNIADPSQTAGVITTVYQAKQMHVVGMSMNYLSTSGKTQSYQAVIVSPSDVTIKGVVA